MLSSTRAIAILMLTSSSKTVCQHIVHITQLSYCSVKLLTLLVWTSDLQSALILVLLNTEYGV